MSFLKFKIRTKLSIVFVIVVLFVVGLTTSLWFTTVRSMLRKEVTSSQKQVGERSAEKVDEFVRSKVRALIIHSQSAAFLTKDANLQKIDLAVFLSQDRDILELTIIDKKGMETAKTSRDNLENPMLVDRSDSPAFIANTFRYNKEYIDEVAFSENGEPTVLISVPIVFPSSVQNLSNLSTESSVALSGNNDLVLGVLEAKISLNSIFKEVTGLGLAEESGVFIVDRNGKVIATKDEHLLKTGIIAGDYPPVTEHVETHKHDPILHSEAFNIHEYTNKQGVKVVGSHSNVKDTSWAIVIEQPVSVVYSNLNKVLNFSIIFLLVSLGLTIPLSYYLAKRITSPVLALTSGANKVSGGDLEMRIKVNTDDELEDMANAFNQMTQKLQRSIEELKNDKEIIGTERNKLEVVLSGIEDAVIALDENHNVVFLNAAAENLMETTNEHLSGRTLNRLIKLSKDNKEIKESDYLENSEGFYHKENLLLTNDKGIEKLVNFSLIRIKDDKSEVRFIITMQDLTSKQKLEEMKTDFVSMAAHELRTPLTSVKGYLDTFMSDYGKKLTKDQLMLITSANTAADRLAELVESLLELTRMEKMGIQLKKEKTSFITLVEKTVENFKKSADTRSVKLVFHKPAADLPFLEIDELRIGEVIANLLSNAIKYTDPKGSVDVYVEFDPAKKSVTTKVQDTGVGIPEDAIPQLFAKFYRVPGKLEQTARGTGLGLYISKKIVDLHKGTIWVESKEGKGSTFAFSLPVKE